MSSSAFIEALQTSKFPDDSILAFKVSAFVEDDILLFESTTKKYVLLLTIDAFYHSDWWNDPGNGGNITSYMNLQCRKTRDSTIEEASTLYLRSEASPSSIEAVFVPLGWLAEMEKEVPDNGYEQYRTTHYVVLWNLSTKPYSLWIVYDYYYEDGMEYGDNHLTDQGLHNKINCGNEQAWYLTEHKYDDNEVPEPGKSIANELLVLHSLKTGLDDPIPPSEDGEDLQKKQQRYHDHMLAVRQARAKYHKPSRIDGTPIKHAEPDFTFLGLTTPFDFACLASDIALWRGEGGIDARHVMDCVAKTHACLGSTLRATPARSSEEGERVEFERVLWGKGEKVEKVVKAEKAEKVEKVEEEAKGAKKDEREEGEEDEWVIDM